jgi:hypothetical protein
MKLGDTLDRIAILSMKLWEHPVQPDLTLELEALLRKVEDPARNYTGEDLAMALRLGAINGQIWTVNDWTRENPHRFHYGTVQKMNDTRRFHVRGLNDD